MGTGGGAVVRGGGDKEFDKAIAMTMFYARSAVAQQLSYRTDAVRFKKDTLASLSARGSGVCAR